MVGIVEYIDWPADTFSLDDEFVLLEAYRDALRLKFDDWEVEGAAEYAS